MSINGYNLTRDWYDFKFENPSKVRANHSDFYLYLVDQWNRLGQKKEFGLPTSYTMECLGIGSYNTYKKILSDLVLFGFVIIVKDSNNQHNSKIIALSKFDKASDKASDEPINKALDKATIKALDKPIDTIIKQYNKLTIEQIKNILFYFNELPKSEISKRISELTKNDSSDENSINIPFDDFWDLYDKKVGEKEKLKKKWSKLKDSERELIMKFIPEYKKSQPDKKYRKNPDTFFNQKSWNDELIQPEQKTEENKFVKIDYSKRIW